MFDIGQKQMPSVMQHSFSRVPQARIPRSQFKTYYENKLTFNADYLIPIFWDIVMPGDTLKIDFNAIIRLNTPLTPFMDNVYCDLFHFYIPNRLVQINWVKLMGEQTDPGDSIDYTTPYFDSPATTGFVPPVDWSAPTDAELTAALFDYLDFTPHVPDLRAYGHVHRAYNLCFNEWFRDQNLQNSVVVDKDDGPDTVTDYKLLKRGKRHDYFTSCLPWPQKGTAIDLPLGTTAPVFGTGIALGVTDGTTNAGAALTGAGTQSWPANNYGDAVGAAYDAGGGFMANSKVFGVVESGSSGLHADLTVATAATINSLYLNFAIQDLLMTDARGGTRYTELVRSHFGVSSPDARLQRPEYLGGGSYPFMVNPLAQLSQTATTELGTLGATATASINARGYNHSFVEHGVVLSLLCVRADLTYQQGLPRKWSKSTRYDFYFPALANLGEQEVLNKEIYAQGSADAAADADTFGYQERWAEYRYGRSMLAGRMRSSDPASLDIWHLAEDFAALPVLNAAFIEQNTPIDRVIAVIDEPHFKADIFMPATWVRPMPLYSVPGLANRF